MYCQLYERDLLYILFIRRFYVLNFNVSSTKDNAHAKLYRYVSYGYYISNAPRALFNISVEKYLKVSRI